MPNQYTRASDACGRAMLDSDRWERRGRAECAVRRKVDLVRGGWNKCGGFAAERDRRAEVGLFVGVCLLLAGAHVNRVPRSGAVIGSPSWFERRSDGGSGGLFALMRFGNEIIWVVRRRCPRWKWLTQGHG